MDSIKSPTTHIKYTDLEIYVIIPHDHNVKCFRRLNIVCLAPPYKNALSPHVNKASYFCLWTLNWLYFIKYRNVSPFNKVKKFKIVSKLSVKILHCIVNHKKVFHSQSCAILQKLNMVYTLTLVDEVPLFSLLTIGVGWCPVIYNCDGSLPEVVWREWLFQVDTNFCRLLCIRGINRLHHQDPNC